MKRFSAVMSAVVMSLACIVCYDSVRIQSLKDNVADLQGRPAMVERTITEKTVEKQIAEKEISVDKGHITNEVFLHILRSTVRVKNPEGFQGSGVVLFSGKRDDPKDSKFYTYVITCAHVLHGADKATIERFDYVDQQFISSTISSENCVVVASDERYDMAVIEVKSEVAFPETASLLTPEEFQTTKLFDSVFACGCALGSDPFVTCGNISSFNSRAGHIQITAPIMYGNSGGGAFTKDGKLLGLTRLLRDGMPAGQVYPEAGLLAPVWAIDKWLRSNMLGFTVNANDGTSIDTVLKARELEAKKAMDKMLEEFMRALKPEESPVPPTLPKKHFR